MSDLKTQAAEFHRLAALQPKNSELEVALFNAALEWDIKAKRYADSEKLQDIGKSAIASIAEMVAALECDYDRMAELNTFLITEGLLNPEARLELHNLQVAAGECTNREEAETRINEDALSCMVRDSQWQSAYELEYKADEFEILLSTGGPATRIIGDLGVDGTPENAKLQAQDWWFQPWTDYVGAEQDTLLTYARCFYFGEG